MATERTLSIIKPDGVEKGIIGKIISRFESNGLKPIAIRLAHLSKREAEGFYAVHKARPFFDDLVTFMTSGPVVLMVLEGENAVAQEPRHHGRHRPEEGGRGDHPQGLRHRHREEHGPRLGQPREREGRGRPTSSPRSRSTPTTGRRRPN